ncbi:hypothetical protein [Bacillus subtilis]|uniref:hypothetical protein n=1 Tax=Bacillus subtilis TaxID=1423 RepID=UPI00227DF75A|nr:hypothetical protein [Bacillus subtilis]MCY8209175.1 hypothetical protein [Bacillus subtilis]
MAEWPKIPAAEVGFVMNISPGLTLKLDSWETLTLVFFVDSSDTAGLELDCSLNV